MASPSPRSPFGDHIHCKSVRKSDQQQGSPHDELFMPMDDPTFGDFAPLSNTSGHFGEYYFHLLWDYLLSKFVGHCRTQSFPSDPVRSPARTRYALSFLELF